MYTQLTVKDIFLFELKMAFLCLITLGIYTPWALCERQNFYLTYWRYKDYRISFYGDGKELFFLMLKWGLLTIVTFGIYGIWATHHYEEWILSNTIIKERSNNLNQPSPVKRTTFLLSVGDLFVFDLINSLLISITLGIYTPWAIAKRKQYIYDNSTIKGYRRTYTATGGELFVLMIKWGLLSIVTLGIYTFWALKESNEFDNSVTRISVSANNTIKKPTISYKSVGFHATVGETFIKLLILGLLCSVTLGIYTPWAIVDFTNWICGNSTFKGGKIIFNGDASELFILMLKGFLLSTITLGIYAFWFVKDLINWWVVNIKIQAPITPQITEKAH